jgi:hypothetical protein
LKTKNLHKIFNILIAAVWLINGLYCKVLNFVPRHEKIVAHILSENFSRQLTILIGISEIIMAIWILTNFKSKLNAITQITIVALMNTLEFILVPEYLYWGKFNSFFALLFIGLIYFNQFVLINKNTHI